MTPARILTVCVGISAYRANVIGAGERPLRYLADSARDLSGHFAAAWPGRGCRHLLLLDEAATLVNVGSVIAAETDHYDSFILYLGGHGRADNNIFEFLFFGEESADAAGSSGIIDAIVAMPDAANVLLFLDCCYAGKYGEETAFFRSLTAGGMRTCAAASRKGQKSREDPGLRRSLFADAIIRVIVPEDGAARLAGHDPGSLLDEIAADVSRHALVLEDGAVQEPCITGASRAAPLQAAVRRRTGYRRAKPVDKPLLPRSLIIMFASIAIIAASLTGFSFVTWHPAINRSGHVVLRSGPQWLPFLDFAPWWLRVETDVISAELIDGAVVSGRGAPSLNEKGMRAWPGINTAQVRQWADVFLDEYLDAEAGARWRVRLGYEDAAERLVAAAASGNDGSRGPDAWPAHAVTVDTATELAAEARILDPSEPLADVWKLQWRENIVPGVCADSQLPDGAKLRLENYLRHSQADRYAGWLRGLALTAGVDDTVGFEEVAELAEMFTAAHTLWQREHEAAVTDAGSPAPATGIMDHLVERPTTEEVSALAGIASAIVARRSAASHEVITPSERTRLLGILPGCSSVAIPVLAALGNHGDPARVMAWARAQPASESARYSLRELAAYGALPGSEILWHLRAQGFSGGPEDRKRAVDNARAWLLAITEVMPLPPDVLTHLMTYASERLATGDIEGARQALAIILRSSYAAQPRIAAEIRGLIERILPPQKLRKMPSRNVLPVYQGDLELLGLLARSGATLTDEQKKKIMNVLDRNDYQGVPRVHYSEHDKGGALPPAQLVIAVNSAHLLALSRLIIGAKAKGNAPVKAQTLNFLKQAIADAVRSGVPLERIRDAITAAAIVRKQLTNREIDAASASNEIRRLAADAAARKAEIEITKAALMAMPRPQSRLVVGNLRTYWRREREPEARLALAEIIIEATANR